MSKKDEVEYEERKAKRYRVGDLEFFVLDDTIEDKVEAGGSFLEFGVKGSRETKRTVHALIVKTPNYGPIDIDTWKKLNDETVMGTLRTYENVSHTDSVVVTTSGELYGPKVCPDCGMTIPTGCARCPNCYPTDGEP